MSSRRKISLTHEGTYYVLIVAFIVIGAFWQQVNLMILLAGLTIGPLLLSWRIAVATMRRLRVRRYLPDHVHAGEPFAVEIVVRNMRRRLESWCVVVKDEIRRVGNHAPSHATSVEVMLPRVIARSSARATYRCTLPERGAYQLGDMSVFTKFPLGLLKCFRRVDSRQNIVVLPRLGHLAQGWYELIHSRQAGSRRSLHRRALTSGGDFYGVRDWQPSDSRRMIHWRITAKLGELAVRQFEELDKLDLTLVLDLWQSDLDNADQSELVETAVSFAATAVKDICRQSGTGLHMFLLGDEVLRLHGPATSRLGQQVLQQLAVRSPSCGYDSTAQLLDVAASTSPAEQIVVISTRKHDEAGLQTDEKDNASPLLSRVDWLFVGGAQGKQCFASADDLGAEATSRRMPPDGGDGDRRAGSRDTRPATGGVMR